MPIPPAPEQIIAETVVVEEEGEWKGLPPNEWGRPLTPLEQRQKAKWEQSRRLLIDSSLPPPKPQEEPPAPGMMENIFKTLDSWFFN